VCYIDLDVPVLGQFEYGYKLFSAVDGKQCYDELSDYQVRANYDSRKDKLHYPYSKLSTPVALPVQ
jgi:hypothetical protein